RDVGAAVCERGHLQLQRQWAAARVCIPWPIREGVVLARLALLSPATWSRRGRAGLQVLAGWTPHSFRRIRQHAASLGRRSRLRAGHTDGAPGSRGHVLLLS